MNAAFLALPALLAGLSPTLQEPAPSGARPAKRGAQVAAPESVSVPARALPADTGFVMHVDVRRILASSFWNAATGLAEVRRALEGNEKVELMKRQVGLDPFRDLVAVTVLGRDDEGDGGVMLVRTTAAIDGAVETLRGVDAHRNLEHGGLVLDAFGDESDGVVASLHATPNGERITVLARDPDDVVRVIRTVEGDAPALADVAAPAIEANPRQGAYFFLELGSPLESRLRGTPVEGAAREVKRLTIQIGEADERFFVEAKVRAGDRESARKVASVVNGMRAFLSMSGAMEQVPLGLQELYDGIAVQLEGDSLRVGFELATRDLAYLLEELHEWAEQR